MRAIFDWLEFKDIGDDLSKNFDESHIRAAIIMYYYAVFSAIREYLIKIKKEYQFLDNFRIHERVWKYLVSSENYNENEVGEFLSGVRHIRNHANYDKKYDFDYFLEKLNEIQDDIENVANSIIYLRNNFSVW